ncbi:MAG: diaminopimelate decarboxylase [Elusimicrobia bacterium]|nr:diaminopimelate decarboxylase [Elusimicrobiota bacterium]
MRPSPLKLEKLARLYSTPLYVHCQKTILQSLRQLKQAFRPCGGEIYYAVKANPRLGILRLLRKEGLGAEAVSWGEVQLCLKAGFSPRRIIFNGNGKTEAEVLACARAGVVWFNFDSLDQWELLEWAGKKAQKSLKALLRVKPEVPSPTHPHLAVGEKGSKFGFLRSELPGALRALKKARFATLAGLHSHFGSQILSAEPFLQSARFGRRLFEKIRSQGFAMEMLDLGGGYGVPYEKTDRPLNLKKLSQGYQKIFQGFSGRVVFEPGRFLVARAGILLTRTLSIKKGPSGNFLVVDAGMTENLRPALYGARHEVVLLNRRGRKSRFRVVGPVCENSDSFGDFQLPEPKRKNLAVISNCGAYASSMGSTYNGRPRPAEVLIEPKGAVRLIRRRDATASLWQNEI